MQSGSPSEAASRLVQSIEAQIITPLLALLFAVALVIFLWGAFQLIVSYTSGSEDKVSEGKKHLLWGVIGMFIMVSAWAIMEVIRGTVGS